MRYQLPSGETCPSSLLQATIFKAIDPKQDDPMVITVEIENFAVKKVLVDQGSSIDILYWETFKKLQIPEQQMLPFVDEIVGFSGERVQTRGYVDLYTTFGEGQLTKTISIRYLVLDANTSYNVLLGRPSLNALGAIVSIPHLAMKFPSLSGDIVTIHVDQRTARECYIASLPNPRKLHSSNNVEKVTSEDSSSIQELDPKMEGEECVKPIGGTEVLPIGDGKYLQIGSTLQKAEKEVLAAVLTHNKISFAWTTSDLPGIRPDIVCHRLSTFKEAKPVAQRKRKLGEEKRKAAREESTKLLQAGFIQEAQYITWLANVVIVKKPNGKWRMCTDYTDLNKACPKDAYPLLNID